MLLSFSFFLPFFKKLISYAKLIFSHVHEEKYVQQFLEKRLGANRKEEIVLEKMRQRMGKAPTSWQTWMKNTVHGFATS